MYKLHIIVLYRDDIYNHFNIYFKNIDIHAEACDLMNLPLEDLCSLNVLKQHYIYNFYQENINLIRIIYEDLKVKKGFDLSLNMYF